MAFDLSAFEEKLYAEIRAALRRFARSPAGKAQTFYAVALHTVYRELGGVLNLPFIAVGGHEEGPPLKSPSSFWSARFSPADFTEPELELSAKAEKLEKALTTEATRGDEKHWRATEKAYFRLLERIAVRLRDDVPTFLPVTADFIAFFHDEELALAAAKKSVPAKLFKKLFAVELG